MGQRLDRGRDVISRRNLRRGSGQVLSARYNHYLLRSSDNSSREYCGAWSWESEFSMSSCLYISVRAKYCRDMPRGGKSFDLSTGRLAVGRMQKSFDLVINRLIEPRNPDRNWPQGVQNWSQEDIPRLL